MAPVVSMPAESSDIAVLGAGYVGLTTGVCLASFGHRVTIADVDPGRVEKLNRGECPIYEPGLARLMREAAEMQRLRFVLGSAEAVSQSGPDFVFICVPTPQDDSGAADLSYVEAVARDIAKDLRQGCVVVVKSTVPVGTNHLISEWIDRDDVQVVSNPEFLREGYAVEDFRSPDRVVIGSDDRAAALAVASLYIGTAVPVVLTDPTSAELIKYTSNAFLAMKLSFANDIASLCDRVGADAADVMEAVGADARIGPAFLHPGPGWGGSCLPKDTRALVQISHEAGCPFELLESAIASNEQQFHRVIEKITAALGGHLVGTRVTLLGLSFKAGTNDLRDSPALRVVGELLAAGCELTAHDPGIAESGLPATLGCLNGVRIVDDALEACKDADLVVIMTEWDLYRELDLEKVSVVMNGSTIVDTRNVLDPERVAHYGISYIGTGRRAVPERPAAVPAT